MFVHFDPCSHAASCLRTATVTLLTFLALPVVGGAQAVSDDVQGPIEEVVVVGTRALPRSVEDSSVPVDIIGTEDFENQAGFDMSNLIRSAVPSFHVSDNPSRDLAALLRPVNLRGLAPDHTLVLMNNKRRHRGSVIQWISNGASNGAQGPDISAIPAIALQRMEVLRDGAAAQYGSDAIAGVLNFVLKDADEGVTLQARYGAYTENSGEDMTTIAANFGLALTDDGFANLSFEYGESAPTDRSVQHQDATALIGLGIPNVAVPAKPWGSPTVNDSIKAVANIGVDLGDSNEFYAFGNYASREVSTAFFFRSPMNRNGVYKTGANKFLVAGEGCAAKYGDIDSTAANLLSFRETVLADEGCFSFVETLAEGFTPQFGATISDVFGVVGVRGELANGLMWDVSASLGENSLAAFNRNTLNASLGPNSPRDFDIGDYTQRDTNFNADVVYPVDLGASDLNVAAGFEARTEEFQITAGERAAWEIGPYNRYGFGSGSNGFGGFNPAASGTWDRGNIAGYLDLEVNPTEAWRIGGAVRFEDFDGFGSTTNYKLATHLRLSDSFALRGSTGTGFRAPTPGQSNARNLSTVVNAVTNEFEERGTIGSTHPVAMALGGRELQPEKSRNLSVGAVLTANNGFKLTVDYFSIDIEDRIALSGLFDVTDDIKERLVADGVPEANEFTSVRYFTNDFDTETTGIDIVASYGWDTANGNADLLFSFNTTDTEVVDSSSISAGTIRNLEHGWPEMRYNLTYRQSFNRWDVVARYSFYGDWYDDHAGADFSGYGLADVQVSYNFASGLAVTLGAENALNEYPDEAVNYGNGRRYPRYSPAGHNGALVYAKVSFSMP